MPSLGFIASPSLFDILLFLMSHILLVNFLISLLIEFQVVDKKLREVNLLHKKDLPVGTYSGGMKVHAIHYRTTSNY